MESTSIWLVAISEHKLSAVALTMARKQYRVREYPTALLGGSFIRDAIIIVPKEWVVLIFQIDSRDLGK